MYQAYISDEGTIFVRHYGTYEGAEGFSAVISIVESSTDTPRIKGVCLDIQAVTDVSLHDTDRANATFLARKLAGLDQQISSICIVQVYDPENVAINKIFVKRDRLLVNPILDSKTIQRVPSMPEALKALGLPVDYCIEYPPEK
jgi:hypothetical protein